MLPKFYRVTEQFLKDSFTDAKRIEVLMKKDRPYAERNITASVFTKNGERYFVPLRSNLPAALIYRYPEAAMILSREGKSFTGFDFTKTLILCKHDVKVIKLYEDFKLPKEQAELLRENIQDFYDKSDSYIKKYKKFIELGGQVQDESVFKYTTLQYFHAELGLPIK